VTEPDAPDTAAALADELEVCRAPLRDFAAALDDQDGLAWSDGLAARVKVDRSVLPVPGLVQLVMGLLVHGHDLGRADKLAWEYPFDYQGRRCAIALQKFGMNLYISHLATAEARPATELAREICAKISAAARRLERNVLSTVAGEQMAAGRVTVHNQVGLLRAMYTYFRRLASLAYAGNGMLARDHDEQASGSGLIHSLRFLAEEREGQFATIAMTSSYFSLLEHLLVLALPATSFDPLDESLTEFILSGWQDKWRRVCGTDDLVAKTLRQRLGDAAERWRNPYAHGGFDKSHGTLSFHTAGVGALPFVMSEYRNHPTFRVVPERAAGYEELTQLFDDVDKWLRTSALWPGVLWAEASMDVPFNPEFLSDFRRAAASGGQNFREFVDNWSEAIDRAANLEW